MFSAGNACVSFLCDNGDSSFVTSVSDSCIIYYSDGGFVFQMSDFCVLSAVLAGAAYLVYRIGTLFAVYGWLVFAFFSVLVFLFRLWFCSSGKRNRRPGKYSTNN